MKLSAIVLAAGLAVIGGASANAASAEDGDVPYFAIPNEQNTQKLDAALKSYAAALASDNEGLVESALAQVGFVAIWMPEQQFEDLREVVAKVANSGCSQSLRFKAYLIGMALESPRLFAHVRWADFRTTDEFYTALTRAMQVTLLGSSH